MEKEQFDSELEDLLSDLHRLLDDETLPDSEDTEEYDLDDLLEGAPLPEVDPEEPLDLTGLFDEEPTAEPIPEPVPEPEPERWTDRQKLPKHVEKLQKNQSKAYAEWLYEQENNPTQAAAAMVQQDLQQTRWTDRQRVPRHVAKLQKNQAQAYADWLYEQEHRPPEAPVFEEEPPAPEKKKKRQKAAEAAEPVPAPKKRRGFRNFLIVLVVLALLTTAAAAFLLPRQPAAAAGAGVRKEGVSTILLMGTDADGYRTDTMLLASVSRAEGRISLVSIPRDTLVQGSYTVPKINSVYGANGGGQTGIDMVMTRVEQCVGFRPDGYVLVELDAFEDFVDAMGGVEFDVPVDMFYNDPSQELFIALRAGRQTLSGKEAMGVVRFRSGYADADLGRVRVQRDFLAALIRQVVSVEGILRSPQLLQIVRSGMQTDLSVGNLLWLAETVLLADTQKIQSATLPGSAMMIGDGSYYVLDPALVAQTVNTYCNPYVEDITAGDLQIRRD